MSRPARALILVALAPACARAPESRAPEPTAPAATDPCIVAGMPGRTADTLDVILDPPPGRSFVPESGSEWFVFATSFETLVRLDCTGAARPALAAGWERDTDGRTWTFRLRDGATFPDSAPLTADSVVAAWRRRPSQSARLAHAGVASMDAVAEWKIRLSFFQPTDSAPALLSDPALAPALDRPEAWRLDAGTVLRLVAPPRDLRDALDAGADIVVTADPATLSYARTQPELVTLPLPWTRTYVLLSAAPFLPAAADGFRIALVRDVVRSDARPAEPPFWWERACVPPLSSTSGARQVEPRVAYPADDATAGALAARLVALGAAGPRGAALPLPLRQVLERLEDGRIAGAVLSLPRQPVVPCAPRPGAYAGWTLTPLVDTREHLVARRDGPGLQADGFGAIRLAPLKAAPQ